MLCGLSVHLVFVQSEENQSELPAETQAEETANHTPREATRSLVLPPSRGGAGGAAEPEPENERKYSEVRQIALRSPTSTSTPEQRGGNAQTSQRKSFF